MDRHFLVSEWNDGAWRRERVVLKLGKSTGVTALRGLRVVESLLSVSGNA